MARLANIGLELQTLTANVEITASGGTCSITTSSPISGSASFRSNPTTGSGWARYQFSSSSSSAQFWGRVKFKIAALPTSTGNALGTNEVSIAAFTTGSSVSAYLTLDTSGILRLYDINNTLIGTSSVGLTTGGVHRLEFTERNTTGGFVEAKLDGAAFATGTGPSLINITSIAWGVGVVGAISGIGGDTATADIMFDDIAINNSTGSDQNSYPGEGKIIRLSPDLTGDANAWPIGAGGTAGTANNYTRVNETIPDGVSTYNTSKTLSQEDLYNVSASGLASGDRINVVQVGAWYAGSSSSANSSFKLEIEKTGSGTKTQGAAITPNSTTYKANANASPFNAPVTTYRDPDNAAWTNTTLDSMQIGAIISTASTNFVRLSTIWAMVDYTAAADILYTSGPIGLKTTLETTARTNILGTVTLDNNGGQQLTTGTIQPVTLGVTTLAQNATVVLFYASKTHAIASVSGGGLTWQRASALNAQGGFVEVWTAFSASILTAQSIAITLSGAGNYSVWVDYISFTGVAQVNPVGASSSANNTTTAPTAALTATRTGSQIWGVGVLPASTATITADANSTLISQQSDGTNTANYWVQQYNTSTVLGTSYNITDTAPTTTPWAFLAVELVPYFLATNFAIRTELVQPGVLALLTTLQPPGATGATLAILTTLESAVTTKTLALKTTLQSTLLNRTLAAKTTLEKVGGSTVALKSTLETARLAATIASKTTLESAITKTTLALKSILESATTKSTVAIKTTLESAVLKITVAIKTTLESAALKSTSAIKTLLEKAPQKATLAVQTTIQPAGVKATLAIKTTLETIALEKTLAIKSTLQSTPLVVPVALKTTLQSAIISKTVALATQLEAKQPYAPGKKITQAVEMLAGVWNGPSATTSYQEIPGVQARVNAADYDGTVTFYFEADIWNATNDITQTTFAQLYNHTDSVAIANSEISTQQIGSFAIRVRTQPITLSGDKDYTVQIRNTLSGQKAQIYGARIIIVQQGVITKTAIYQQIGIERSAISSTLNTNRPTGMMRYLYEAGKFDGTITMRHDAVLLAPAAQTITSGIYDETAGAVVSGSEANTTNSSTYTRVSSGAITLTDQHIYRPTLYVSGGSTGVSEHNSIVILLTNFTKYQALWNLLATLSDATTSTNYVNDSDKSYQFFFGDFAGVTTNYFYEALQKSNNVAGVALGVLWSLTDGTPWTGSDISVTGTTDQRARSAAITPPLDGKTIGIAVKSNSGSFTAQVFMGYLVIEVSNFSPTTIASKTTLETAIQKTTLAMRTLLEEPAHTTFAMVTRLETGRNLGKAIFFSSNGYITVPTTAALHPADVLTVAITLYSQNWAGITDKRSAAGYYGNGSGFTFNTNNTPGDGTFWFILHRGAGIVQLGISLNALTPGKHRFIGTFDGRFTKFYVDDVLQTTDDFGSVTTIDQVPLNAATFGGASFGTPYFGGALLTTNDLGIGDNSTNRSTPTGNGWNDGLDEFLLVHAAWTQTDIDNDYGRAGGIPLNKRTTIPNLVVGMHFDDNTATDFSGNSNTGTVIGSASYATGFHVGNPPVALLTTLEPFGIKKTLGLRTTLQSIVTQSTVALCTTLFATIQRTNLALATNIVYRGGGTIALTTPLEVQPISAVPRGIALSGFEDGQAIIPGTLGTDYFDSDQPTANYFAQKGLNFIKLPVSWERLQPSLFDPLDTNYLTEIQAMIARLALAKLSTVIEIHNFGRRNIINTGGFSLLTSGSSDPMFFGNFTLASGVASFNPYNRIYAGSMDNPKAPATSYVVNTQLSIVSDNGQPWAGVYLEFLRKNDNNRYYLLVSASGGYVALYKVVNGVTSQVGSNVSQTVGYNTFNTINIDVGQTTAGQVAVTWNGVTIMTTALDPLLTTGQVAIWGNATTGQIQNFSVNINGDTTSGRTGSGFFRVGDPQISIAAFADLWSKLATQFSNDSRIYGYGLMNEPHDMPVPQSSSTYNTTATVTLMNQAGITAIRAVDKKKWIFMPTDNWSGGQSFTSNFGSTPTKWWTDTSNKTVLEFHYYFDTDYSGNYATPFVSTNLTRIATDLSPIITWANANNVRLLAGEYGIPNDRHDWDGCLLVLLDLLNTNTIWGQYWLAGSIYMNQNQLSLEPSSFAPIAEKAPMQITGRATYLGQLVDMATFAIKTTLEATRPLNPLVNQPMITIAPTLGTMKHDAVWINNGTGASYLQLTPAINTKNGQIEFSRILPTTFDATFDLFVSTTGADAIYFYWGCTTTPQDEDVNAGGYIFAFDEWSGEGHPYRLQFAGSELAFSGTVDFADAAWHTAKISVQGNTITVFLDGVQKFTFTDSTRILPGAFFGWGARTGGVNAEHRVRNLFVVDKTTPATVGLLTSFISTKLTTIALKTVLEAVVPIYASLDQQNTTNGLLVTFGQFTGNRYRGFGFTPTQTGFLRRLAFVRSQGTQDIKIYLDAAHGDSSPIHAVGQELFSFTVPQAQTGGYQVYTLPTPLYVVAGRQYCIYIAPWNITNNQYQDDVQNLSVNTGSYSGGQEIVNINGTWTNDNITPVYALWIQPATSLALFTNITYQEGQTTLALTTILIHQSQQALALATLFVQILKQTIAIQTTLQSASTATTLALQTSLEVIPHYTTLAVQTTLEVLAPQVPIVSEPMVIAPLTGTLTGIATWITAGYLLLTPATSNVFGTLEYNQILPSHFETTFDFWIGGGSGADAIYFYFGNSQTPINEQDPLAGGYEIAFEEYFNEQKPFQVSFGGVLLGNTTGSASFADSNWHKARITFNNAVIQIYLDGVLVLSVTDAPRTLPGSFFGWGARTAALTNQHRIRNIILNSTPLTNLALLTTLEQKPVSTVAIRTILEKPVQGTVALLTTLVILHTTSGTIALNTTLETITQNATLALGAIFNQLRTTTIAIKTTLEAPSSKTIAIQTTLEAITRGTVALKTTLESAQQFNTLALKTTLESKATTTILAVKTTLERTVQAVTVALTTRLEAMRNARLALIAALNTNFLARSLALQTFLVGTINATLSVLTLLETIPFTDTVALFTLLETAPFVKTVALKTLLETSTTKQTLAMQTTLERVGAIATLALKTTLEVTPQVQTVALLTTLEVAPRKHTLAVKTTLETTVRNSTLAIKTTLETAGTTNTIALATRLEPAGVKKTLALITILEIIPQHKTLALATNLDLVFRGTLATAAFLEAKKLSNIALTTQFESAIQRSTVALFTFISLPGRSTLAIYTDFIKTHPATVALGATLVHFIGWHNDDFGHLGWQGNAQLNVPTPVQGIANDGHPYPPTGGYIDDGTVW